ncbi:hypothetical protein T4A_8311, partial [Trichinella pseudospiralis]
TEEKIEWRFSCERAPWCGGYWEKLVRSVKTAFCKVLAKAVVSREELVTILCEIEARINARPLTTISDDSNDLEPLTPSHFVTGRTLMELPDMTTRRLVGNKSTSTTMTLRRRCYYQRKILRHLWQRWRKEYLVNFNNRQKWKTQKLELNIGDIILLCEDGQTRSWNMKTENLRKKQAGYKIRLLKWMQKIRQLCTDNASRSMVRNALKELGKQFDKVQLLQEELEEGLSLDDLEKEIDEFRTLEQEILEIRSIAEDFIEEMT